MMNISIDYEKLFDNCDVPDAEAVVLMADFFQRIAEDGVVNAEKLKVTGIVDGISDSLDDIDDRCMMESAILDSVMQITQMIRYKVEKRISQLNDVHEAINKIDRTLN